MTFLTIFRKNSGDAKGAGLRSGALLWYNGAEMKKGDAVCLYCLTVSLYEYDRLSIAAYRKEREGK